MAIAGGRRGFDGVVWRVYHGGISPTEGRFNYISGSRGPLIFILPVIG